MPSPKIHVHVTRRKKSVVSELSRRTHTRMQMHVRLTFEDPLSSQSVHTELWTDESFKCQIIPIPCMTPCSIVVFPYPVVLAFQARTLSSLEELHNIVYKLHVYVSISRTHKPRAYVFFSISIVETRAKNNDHEKCLSYDCCRSPYQ